jgi:cytoskeletal protein CcmA (bactofilin family)
MMATMAEEDVVVAAGAPASRKGRGGCALTVCCGCLVVVALAGVLGLWIANRVVPFIGYNWNAGESFHVAGDQTVSESILFFGERFMVEGTVDGNLSMAGERMIVDGTVNGDVDFLGERLKITGTVNGDIRFLGGRLEIGGTVTGNVSFTGEAMVVTDTGMVEGDVSIRGESLENNGTIKGAISGSYATVKNL